MINSFTSLFIFLQGAFGLIVVYFIFRTINRNKSTPILLKVICLVFAFSILFRVGLHIATGSLLHIVSAPTEHHSNLSNEMPQIVPVINFIKTDPEIKTEMGEYNWYQFAQYSSHEGSEHVKRGKVVIKVLGTKKNMIVGCEVAQNEDHSWQIIKTVSKREWVEEEEDKEVTQGIDKEKLLDEEEYQSLE